MKKDQTFDFAEALFCMQCGLSVIGPGERLYKMDGNAIICYPKPKERPKQKRVETKFTADTILYKNWTLAE